MPPSARDDASAGEPAAPAPPAPAGVAADPAAASVPAPEDSLRAALRDLVSGLCGAPLDAAGDTARFLDLGLDSLALTQLALEIERRHGVRLKFRRLMEDIDTIERLAALIGSEAPPPQQRPGDARAAAATAAEQAAPPPDAAPAPFGAAARITKRAQAALDARQAQWLREFTARYTQRTARSKAFSQEQRAGMADPRVVTGFNPLWKELVYPIVVARSHGACLEDVDGNEYVDLLNAFGANFLGYQPDFVTRALKEQVDAGFEIGPQHPLTAEVAALIREMTGVERVAFCNTGSEAVMGAMRIARTVTGRRTIVIFRDSYHGIFDEVIVRGTPQLRSIAAAPGILASAVENVLVLEYGAEASLQVIRERAHELAAVMIEPVQARNPELQPHAFVQQLRALCDGAGCALIFDEVITGFRIAPGGAQEFYGVRADIATYGKIIGGGLPLAVIGGAARWLDALDGGDWRFGDDSRPEAGVTYFAGTFVRHPLALAAAKAALLHLREQGGQLQRGLNARTQALVDRLDAFFTAHAAPMRAVCFSSLWRVRIDDDQPLAELFHYALRARGLHVYAQFNCFLSAAHGPAEVERIAAAVEAATLELLDAGILRRRARLRIEEPRAPRAGEPARDSSAPKPFDLVASAALPPELPLTDAQAEKWLACQFGEAASVAFNESQLLLLDGVLDRARLERAVATVCARHEAFATSFAADGSVFRVGASAAIVPSWLDLSGARAADSLQAHCAAAVRRPFDLTRAPLARIDLVRLAPERHALLVVAHHLVFDGWSAAVFLDEVARCYRAGGAGARLPPAESLRAFALARQRREAPALAAQLDWWTQRFATVPERIELPFDRPRPLQPDFAANTIFHDFPEPLTAALRAFSRRHGVTLYSTLLAGFGVLLARLTGQHDFAIGIPFASQAAAGSGALLGDGVNTLPVRIDVAGDEPFASVARHCHRALLDAAEHQDVTLYTLLNALDARLRAERSGLADVIFNLNPRVPALDFGALRHSVRDCAKAALVRDLFFNLNDRGETLTLDLHYRTALFDAATMVRWIGHFETLLRAACAAPETPAARLALLDDAQRALLADDAGASARAWPDAAGLVALVREQARRTPARIALECAGATWSYSVLMHRVDVIAATLAAAGVGAGEVVGVCVPRGNDLVAALLGVLASGAAYLPLDAGFPERRLRFVLDDAGVRHVVVGSAGELPHGVLDGRAEHALDALRGGEHEARALPAVGGDALAYVLYTSGSTGEPKGVPVRQRSLVNLLLSMREQPGLRADDVFCAVTTPTFDIAALELFLPLLCGARVLIASDAEHRDPDALVDLLRTRGATALQTTPSLLRRLVDGGRAAALPRLKLLVGGEELPRDLAEAVLPRCAELWNLYGPTETTIWSTLERVTPGSGSVPIGRPIANTRAYVVDAHGELAAPGVRGELWIGGAGVADGYLNRPELTAQRFLADPFRAGGARVYRTGDCASWREGRLYFHGRLDDQVKVRGFRIEPGDVEAAALEDARVRAAAAAVHEKSPGDRRLVLYVVADAADAGFEQALRERLRRRLPPYMVPAHVERLDALPHTAHGKVDRKALPAPRGVRRGDAAAAAPAGREPTHDDALAHALLGIWRELIGDPGIELDSNFFDVGGDSLLGVELFQRAHALTGVSLPLATLLSAQTVREQARAFREAGARGPEARKAPASAATADPWSPLVAIQGRGDGPPLFCVHAIGGNVLNYAGLARALGPRQPVYGLQAIGLDGVTPPLLTIEEMAARYLPELRARFPRGPYWLCGGSMGGLIAYEMAQRLCAAGEEVAFLGLFDTYGPDDGAQRAAAGALRRWRERFARLRGLDAHERAALFAGAARQRLRRAADAARVRWHRLRGTPLPVALRYREIERVHLEADSAYRPRPYAGSVTLFRAGASGDSPTLGWDRYAGALRVVTIPGSHDSLIEQPELVVQLRHALAQTRSERAAAAHGARA